MNNKKKKVNEDMTKKVNEDTTQKSVEYFEELTNKFHKIAKELYEVADSLKKQTNKNDDCEKGYNEHYTPSSSIIEDCRPHFDGLDDCFALKEDDVKLTTMNKNEIIYYAGKHGDYGNIENIRAIFHTYMHIPYKILLNTDDSTLDIVVGGQIYVVSDRQRITVNAYDVLIS